MELFFEDLINWIFTLSPWSIYIIFFVIAYLENIIPPVPGDVLVAFGGYLAAEKLVDFTILLLITTIASVIGFMNMYAFGAFWGYRIDKKQNKIWLMRFIDMKYFERGRRWMQNWGQWVIVANRFLAGTRSVIAITAGIYRTKINYTILSSSVSSLIWNTILLSFGWIVHENWHLIGSYLGIYGWIILALILTAVIGRILYKWFYRNKRHG